MIRSLLKAGPLALGLLLPQAAWGQPSALDKYVTDERARATLTEALKRIAVARCENDRPCAPATERELKQPPISLNEARAAMKAGITSGMMQWCGLDWQRRSFLPMMTYHRKVVGMNDRQAALMALLHGSQQGQFASSLMKGEPCSPEVRAKLNAQMPGPQ